MFNFLAKCLLVSTSLSPVLLVMAVSQFESGLPCTRWLGWPLLGAVVVLVVLCRLLLRYAEKRLQELSLQITSFERRDQEVLTFLFIYMLPLIRTDGLGITAGWITTACVGVIIIYALAQAGAFHFNPLMRLFFGYRFYSVITSTGVTNLLISQTDLRMPGEEVRTVRLDRGVYLVIGSEDA